MKFFNKKSIINNSGFTFIELVVSLFISSILLGSIFYFISSNIEDIFLSNSRTELFNQLNNFRNDILSKSNVYSSGTLIRDGVIGSGSDILLLQSKIKDDGYLIGVVSINEMKFESPSILDYNRYYNKSLGYVRVSSGQISAILSNTGSVKDMYLSKDHVFETLKVKDFQVDLYNSGSIINMDMTLITNYNQTFEDQSWNNLKGTEFIKVNLNF